MNPPRLGVLLGCLVLIQVAVLPGSVQADTTIVADAFDRPDSATLGAGWQEEQGDLVVGSQALRNAAGLAGTSIAVQPVGATDQSASATFQSAGNNSIPVLGFVLRYQSAQAYYLLYRQAGGTSVLRVAKVINGQETLLAQAGVSNPTENAWFTMAASAVGSTLSLTFGSKTITATDSTIASGGVGLALGSRTTNGALRFSHLADTFSASVTTPGPPVPRLAVSLGSEPAPGTVTPGATGVTMATLVLSSAGSAEDVAVSSVQLNLETDTGGTNPTSCQLLDGSTVMTTGVNIVGPSADGPATFTFDAPLPIPAGTQRSLRVRCDVPSGAPAGDSVEWRLDGADVVVAEGAVSGQEAVVSIQASVDNQNRLTIQAAGSNGDIDETRLRPVLRAAEISYGPDLGEQAPGYETHLAVNFTGQSPPSSAWLTVCDDATHGSVTVCADHLDSEINGEQCGGVVALETEGPGARAIIARSCDAKATDTLRLGILDTTTGAVTALVNVGLKSRIDTYGGTTPPANCDHNRGQPDFHMYCQWIRTCLTITVNPDGSLQVTATSSLRGTGPKNDPSRNDPNSPLLTLIGTATWSGARPSGVATIGRVGLAGTATQGLQRVSLTNLWVAP